MTKGTISREEIKEQLHHDELGDFLKQSGAFIQKHRFTLIGGLVALILLIIVWQLIQYRAAKAVEGANIAYLQAQRAYSEAVFSSQLDASQRQQKLEETVQQTESLRQLYSGTPAVQLAHYLEGNAYLAMVDEPGKDEHTTKAIATFQQYVDSASSPEEKARGYLGLAAAYQNRAWLKDDPDSYKRAEKAYQDVLSLVAPNSYLGLEAKTSLAGLHAALGDTVKAAELYREVIATAGKEEPTKVPPGSDSTPSDRQRIALQNQIENMLTYYDYGKVAERELQLLVPSSAKDLGVALPEESAAPAQP